MTTTTVVLVCLAVYRGTLLVTSDRVTRTPRRWLRARLRQRSHTGVDRNAATYMRCRCDWVATISSDGGAPPFVVTETGTLKAAYVRDSAPTLDAAAATLTALWDKHRREAPDTSRLGFLLECPWCVGQWLGIVGAAVAWAWPDGWWRWPALALAASAVAGLLATIASPDDLDPED